MPVKILYSDAIFSFLEKARGLARRILREEVGLAVERGRDYFYVRNVAHPLHLVTFEHFSRLGYFQAEFYEVGINKVFLFENDEKLCDLLRHELAHYLTFIEHGPHATSHGREFHGLCKRYGWSAEVPRAVIPIEKMEQHEKLLKRVRKLLSLSQSHHQGEAEAATIKAQELLIKHNLNVSESYHSTCLLRILPQRRCSAKLRAISSILRTFFVYPVFSYTYEGVHLEILGEKIDVEIAEYVAHFLDQKFEMLWEQAKREQPNLKGISAKNSFFRGLSQGYALKVQALSAALVEEKGSQLVATAHRIYSGLSNRRSYYREHRAASALGKEKGQNLTIQKGIKTGNGTKLIT